MSKNICPHCDNYERCKSFGWTDTETCVNFQSLCSGYAIGSIEPMFNTLQIDKCDRIIFRDKTLDFVFEIGHDQYKDINTIIVNGVKFERV